MDDQLKRQAYGKLPAGHAIVKEGEIRPTDLIWSWTTKEWLRADDPEWGPHKFPAEECVAVCRATPARPSSAAQNYTVKRGYEESARTAPAKPQNSLF